MQDVLHSLGLVITPHPTQDLMRRWPLGRLLRFKYMLFSVWGCPVFKRYSPVAPCPEFYGTWGLGLSQDLDKIGVGVWCLRQGVLKGPVPQRTLSLRRLDKQTGWTSVVSVRQDREPSGVASCLDYAVSFLRVSRWSWERVISSVCRWTDTMELREVERLAQGPGLELRPPTPSLWSVHCPPAASYAPFLDHSSKTSPLPAL